MRGRGRGGRYHFQDCVHLLFTCDENEMVKCVRCSDTTGSIWTVCSLKPPAGSSHQESCTPSDPGPLRASEDRGPARSPPDSNGYLWDQEQAKQLLFSRLSLPLIDQVITPPTHTHTPNKHLYRLILSLLHFSLSSALSFLFSLLYINVNSICFMNQRL